MEQTRSAQRNTTEALRVRVPSIVAVLVAVSIVSSCEEATAPGDVAPTVLDASLIESANAVFRSLRVELDRPGLVEVDYWTDGAPRLRSMSGDSALSQVIRLPRLRPNSFYQYVLTPIGTRNSRGASVEGEFETDTLPAALAQVRGHTVGTSTFPLLMLEVVGSGVTGSPIVMDRDGRIVWYRHGSMVSATGVSFLSNGDLAINAINGIDIVKPDNELVARLSEEDAAARTGLGGFQIHHDVIETPDERLLFLVQDTATVGDTVWTGEAIWEWDYATDALVKKWAAIDFLTPSSDRGARTALNDWLHANSLSFGPRGNVLVSFFWTHEVISLAADFQSIEWRLGGPSSTFDLVDGVMGSGQHTAAEVVTDRILMFDNGLDRPGGELYSRALEVAVDRESGSAEAIWEFRPFPDIYAPVLGSARRLDNGNTVVTFGVSAGVTNPPASGPLAIYEVSATRTVWLLHLEGVSQVYRAMPMYSIAGESEVNDRP